ncbi:MAG: hypothetical protein H7336_07130 [Bacteriovorax sp.]|nr:hypothetical protein [Bacteriovorax sp.]
MKTALMALSIFVMVHTSQAKAVSFGMTTFLSSGNYCKEAALVINEGNEYLQTGVMGVVLLKEVQNNQDISDR